MPQRMTLEKFLEKAREIHGEKYIYKEVKFTKMLDEVIIICPKHGKFLQKPAVHVNDKCGCPTCGLSNKNKKTLKQFISDARKVHGNQYDYSKANYKNTHTKIEIICSIHGSFWQKPEAHINQKQGCKKCGYSERKLPNQKTTDQFIIEASKKWSYDYSSTVYKNKQTKIKFLCSKHGLVEQKPALHLKNGCPYCNGRGISRHNTVSFLNLANKIHGERYDYSLVKLNKITDYIDIICPKHGVFNQRANNHIHLKNGCPQCISIVSKPEIEVLDFIRKNYSGKILNNDRAVLNGKEIDIYLPEIGIGFEYHGMYWHVETVVGRKKHWVKANESVKIQLIQIYEHEWSNKRSIVESKIMCLLGKARRIYARKTTVKKIGWEEKNEFLDRTHIQGRCNSVICYGLYYDEELVSCMTFGVSRFNRNYDYELVRYSSGLGVVVVGGAARLLRAFLREYSGSIISYADRRWSVGNLYKKLGFRLDGITKPSFAYYHINRQTLHNRMSFQKKMLKGMCGYSEDLSEYEIMQLNGFDRIWDAGQLRFVLN